MKLTLTILLLLLLSCSPKKEVVGNSSEKLLEQPLISEPPVLVYKTKRNYNNLVPILMSEDGKTIISYPHPKDLIVGSGYPLPTILNSGYLIDNRGIGKNVAFLSISYEEYSKLQNVPSIEELYMMIIDKEPLLEFCNCGTKSNFTNIEKEINYLIANNKLNTICKLIK
jgi:hypothetical protein